MQKPPIPPFIMVIFGSTGDLTYRKLMPALFSLFNQRIIDGQSQIVGFARRPFSDEEFREMMNTAVTTSHSGKRSVSWRRARPESDSGQARMTVRTDMARMENGSQNDVWNGLSQLLVYQQGRFEDASAYKKLSRILEQFDKKHQACCNKLYYLATPPKHYSTILDNLKMSGLSYGCGEKGGWTRILIEKPFGKDLESARALDSKLASLFDERQIYRIDHYLGKESIQNIITFRFANGIFEPVWNKDYIDCVQITMSETQGVKGRGVFYDDIGALRDVMQNHMLAMLSLIAMEQPKTFSADGVRNARCKAIEALRCIEEGKVDKYVVRGQYGKGIVFSKPVVGYQQEENIDKTSTTETFVAVKAFVDTERWQGIPWYLRAGKRLPKDSVEISIVFKQTCHILFKEHGCPEEGNVLTLKVSPNEGIAIRFVTKEPGHAFSLKSADLDFSYKEAFVEHEEIDAYEKILEEALSGDQMLFARSDELEASWLFINKILYGWKKGSKPNFPNYSAGSWGPKEAQELIEEEGRKWILQ